MTADAALSREPGSQEQRFDGEAVWRDRGFRAPVSSGGSGPRGSFGSRRSREPGLRARLSKASGLRAGGRPGSREVPSGAFGERAARQPTSGDGEPFRGPSVRRRRPGCPADPGFRREGAGRASTLTFPARTASLPRVGRPADPGPRGPLAGTARRSHRPRKAPARVPTRSGQSPARGGFGDLERQPVRLRAADCSDGILRDPARAPGRPWTIAPQRLRLDGRTPGSDVGKRVGMSAGTARRVRSPSGEVSDLAALISVTPGPVSARDC